MRSAVARGRAVAPSVAAVVAVLRAHGRAEVARDARGEAAADLWIIDTIR